MIARALVVVALLVATLTGSATSSPVAAAPAAAPGACTTAEGVTVIVSFNDLPPRTHQTLTLCASGRPSSGFDALSRVGLPATQPQRMPGFVCRIDGLPADDPCINTPSTTAYWAYWVAPRGGRWCYSNAGPGRTPPPGTVEGWSFSRGRSGSGPAQPRMDPPPALPGVTPTQLPAGHCTSTPTVPGTTVPSRPTPTPVVPAPPRADSPTGPTRPGGGSAGSGGGGTTSPADPVIPGAPDGDPRPDGGLPAEKKKENEDPEADGADDASDGGEADSNESHETTGDSDEAAADEEAAVLEAWEEEAEAAAGGGPTVGSDDSGNGSPWALIGAAVLVVGLGVGGYLRNRRIWTG